MSNRPFRHGWRTACAAALFPLAAAVRTAKRLAHVDSADDKLPASPLNALFRKIFSAEAAWLTRYDLPFGLSVIVIGRRPDVLPKQVKARPRDKAAAAALAQKSPQAIL